MSAYAVIITLFLLAGASAIVIANMIAYTILGEVNGKRPPSQQIGMLFVNIRLGQVLRLHADLFPESPKRQQVKLLFAVGLTLIAASFILDIAHYGHF